MSAAHADGFVTTNEFALDQIYFQSSFGFTPLDFRFSATPINIFNSSLTTLDNDAEFSQLAGYRINSPVISMFFVDHLLSCGGPADGIVGCGSAPGSLIAVDSAAASTTLGAVIVAHELGHNLGLNHVAGIDTNLMNPEAYSGPAPAPLNAAQVTKIFTSPWVQHDAAGYFVQVQTFAILSSVPEASTFALMGLGLGLIAFARGYKRRNARVALPDASCVS